MAAHPAGQRQNPDAERVQKRKSRGFEARPFFPAPDAPSRQKRENAQRDVAKILVPFDFLRDFVGLARDRISIKSERKRHQQQAETRQLHPKRALAPNLTFFGNQKRRHIETDRAQKQTKRKMRRGLMRFDERPFGLAEKLKKSRENEHGK